MAEPYLKRGVENPAIIDLVTSDRESGEAVLVMIEPRPWSLGRDQLEQLNDKLNAYFAYVLDGHFAEQYPQYLGLPVRLELASVEEPSAEAKGMLRMATALAEENGMCFVLRRVEPGEIGRAPWEREAAEEGRRPSPLRVVGPEPAAFTTPAPPPPAEAPFRPEVLEALSAFGLQPRSDTRPEKLRELLNSLYVFEIRELRYRHRELERVLGPQPRDRLAEQLAALRERYALLSLPVERWKQPASTPVR